MIWGGVISVERKVEGRVADGFTAYRDPESLVSIRAEEHRPTQPAFFIPTKCTP